MRFSLSALRFPSRRALLRAALWALFALYVGFAALTFVLRYWLLPELPRYQPEIEATASRVLGAPVRLGRLEAHWTGLNPALRLENVRILNEQGEVALSLARVEGVLSWHSLISLWKGEPRFALLTLEKPELLIRRDKAGDIFVAGILLSGSDKDDGQALDWLLQQSRLRINDARLVWQDELRAAPPLVLQDVRLEWRNRGSRHTFGLSAQPPVALAAKLDVRGDFRGDTEWRDWRGQIYARLDALDLTGGRAWFDAPVELERGHGAARLWVQRDKTGWQGTSDFALTETRLRLDAALPMLDLERLQGRLQVTHVTDTDEWRIVSRDLRLDARTDDARPMHIPDLNLQLEWQGEQFPPRQGALFADTLDLTRLRQLAAWLPLPADSREMLATHQPEGVLRQIRLRWEMDRIGAEAGEATLKKYSLEAGFSDLGIKAAGVFPGTSGLSGVLSATEQGGTLSLDSRNATLALPAVFVEPEFPLERVQAQVEWQHNAEGVRADIRRLDFTGPHAHGQVSGHYQSLPQGPGRIDLQGTFTQARATEVWRYIPRVSGVGVAQWLRGALLAGRGEASLKLRGDLAHFPFARSGDTANAHGEFRIAVKARDVKLNYGDDWPEIEALEGDLEFGEGMKVLARSGRTLGAKLQNVRVEIPRFVHDAHLLVAGEAVGPTTEFLRFIEQSPVAASIDRFTQDMTATGQGKLELKLELPLARLAESKVWGRYHLEANTVAFMPGLPPAREVQGSLEFTEGRVDAPEIHALFLGAPLRLKIASSASSATAVRIEANGGFTAKELAQHFNHPGLAALSGSASWQAEIKLQKKVSEFRLTSSLEGLASALPAPFAKKPGERLSFSLQKTPAGTAREQIRIELGDESGRRLSALIWRRANGEIERGVIGIGQPSSRLPVPDKGLHVLARQNEVNLDDWCALLTARGGSGEAPPFRFPFDLLALEAQKLTAFGQVFDTVSLRLRPDGDRLNIMVAAQEIVGDLYWSSAGQGKLTANLRRVRLESGRGVLASQGQQNGDTPELIDSLPGMDVRIDDFTYNKRRFGRVELQAENVGRHWKLNRIVIENPAGRLTGSGLWQPGAGGLSTLDFKLDATDSGKLLERMGYPGAILGGTATLSGQLQWPGSPLDFDAATLDGGLQLVARKGQFSRIDPGAGKLLGLLSLQSLTRRLSLDFRDVFSDGFAYDSIAATMQVKEGIMTTDGDLQINSPSGKVLMNGKVDMKHETQTLNLTMQPELGGVTAVGAAVATLNPLVGAAALLAQNFLKNPLNKVFSLKYTVTGSWAEPKVERIPLLQHESAAPPNPSTEEKTP
ncbi:MAG: TIGR02099 family protein [Zoogloeaceae bacterium]|jgi:uncharacterized protein (TIGR02099 family)|nr:TIGR02099 family protein [Zoogloeaceae bacterium]